MALPLLILGAVLAGGALWAAYESEKRALLEAAKKGDLASVERLLAAGADVNYQDEGDYTPLMGAASRGHNVIVERLLAAGADVHLKDEYGKMALKWAVRRGCAGVVKRLLAAGAKVNLNSELVGVASRGYAGVVRCLLAAGADVNHWEPDPDSTFGSSVWARLTGADVDHWGLDPNSLVGEPGPPLTALMAAARRGHTDIVQCLLATGADVHLKDEYGKTALHFAVANGHDAIGQHLRAAGSTI